MEEWNGGRETYPSPTRTRLIAIQLLLTEIARIRPKLIPVSERERRDSPARCARSRWTCSMGFGEGHELECGWGGRKGDDGCAEEEDQGAFGG